jgi:phage gp16-like protein
MAQTKRKTKNDYRRALLAKVHIAKKALGVDEDVYRMILREEFGVESAGDLSNRELAQLVARFEKNGWKGTTKHTKNTKYSGRGQVDALKERARAALDEAVEDGLVNSERGLVKKICGVDDLRWCGEAVRLKRLLAVLQSIECKGE